MGGGGGGGGVVYNSAYAVSPGNITVTVGNGGAGAPAGVSRPRGSNGGNSIFGLITAIGGGGGASEYSNNNSPASSGGSGGGAAGCNSTAGAAGTAGQGYAGGGTAGCYYPGGGGGAGGAGGTNPANGGPGVANSITGTTLYYGGGGGGAGYSGIAGNGGIGGGGGGAPKVSGGGLGGRRTLNPGSDGTVGTLTSQTNVPGGNGGANTGGGGGGGAHYNSNNYGGNGGSGVILVSYPNETNPIKTQGTYSLKGIAQQTTSLNKTLTKTIGSPINLSGYTAVSFDIRASRTGSNIKVGFRDSGGTTTEITPNITQADTFQTVNLDISGVTNANKDAIDQIIVTIVNADAVNTFYIDNLTATASNSFGDSVTKTVQATNLSNVAFITYRVYSTVAGTYATFGFGESAATEQTQSITINQANTWETKTFDLSSISGTARDAVTKFAFTFNANTSGATFYFDDIQSHQLFTPTIGAATVLSTSSIRWGFTDNALDETGFAVHDSNNNIVVTCNGSNLTYCDETGLQVNTQYTRKVTAIKNDIGSYLSDTVSKYTLANVPGAISVARSQTTAQFTLSANGNPSNTEYAIYKDPGNTCDGSGGSYLATNGSDNGSSAVWATYTNWGTAGTVTASNLGREQKYTFCVKARNGDNVETGFGGIGSSNTGEIVPISGNYTINTDSATNFVTRYRDGSNPNRYIIGLDNVGANGSNDSEINIQGGSVTVNSNETLVAGKMNFTGGTLFLATGGGQLAPGARLWTIDRDQDGFPDTLGGEIKVWYGTSTTPTSTVSASYFRRKALLSTLAVADCNDNAYSLINSCCLDYTYYLDADGDGYGSTTTNVVCQEVPSTPPGYVTNNTDCNDNNANRWRLLPGYVDSDGDSYGAGAQQNVCSGSSLLAGYVTNNLDCNDTTATITTITATGGTVTNLTGYKVHRFASSGTFDITCGGAPIEYLVVAGGRGGHNYGSGGRGGQVSTGTINLTAGAHTVTIGAGGASNGGSGGNSVFSSITSAGATLASGYGDTLSPPAGGTYSSMTGSNTLYRIYGAASTRYGGGWNCSMDSGGPYSGYGRTGVANTGGGGSAGDCRGSGEGCAAICTGWPGGSGVVVVRYQVP